MIIGKEECGCEIWQDTDYGAHIEYCKKHTDVFGLYEALRGLLEWARVGFSDDTGEWADENDPSIKQAEQALARSK